MNGLTIAIHLLHEAGHRNPGAGRAVPLRDLLFLHRLYTSHDIQGTDCLARIRQEIGLYRFLYLLYRRKACSQSLLGNLLHAWSQGAWRQCAAMAHEIAVAHLRFLTSPCSAIRTITRYGSCPTRGIAACRNRWSQKLVRIMVDCESSRDEESRRFVIGCLDFVDDVIAAAVNPLSWVSGHARAAKRPGAALKSSRHGSLMPASEWEAVYHRKVYGMDDISNT